MSCTPVHAAGLYYSVASLLAADMEYYWFQLFLLDYVLVYYCLGSYLGVQQVGG